MKFTQIILPLLFTGILSAQTIFILGDNYSSNGDGTVTGNTPAAEITGLYNQNSNPPGATGNPSFFNAIMVGSGYGDSNLWRAVTSFDLGGIPAAPAGFSYDVTDVTLILEVSGGTNDGRPATLIDFYEGSTPTGSFSNPAVASNTFDSPNGTFVPISFGATDLDLNSATDFSVTLDAPNAATNPGQNFYTFGSGLGPNIGFGGTNAVVKAPELQISYNLVNIPEPTTFSLFLFSTVGLITVRKRK